MPTYDYVCKNCGYNFEIYLKIDEREIPTRGPCAKCGKPEIVQTLPSSPGIGDPVRLGIRKPDKDFVEVLKAIKKKNHGATMNIRE